MYTASNRTDPAWSSQASKWSEPMTLCWKKSDEARHVCRNSRGHRTFDRAAVYVRRDTEREEKQVNDDQIQNCTGSGAVSTPHRVPSHSQIYSLKFILEKGRTDCPIVGAHCLHTRKVLCQRTHPTSPFSHLMQLGPAEQLHSTSLAQHSGQWSGHDEGNRSSGWKHTCSRLLLAVVAVAVRAAAVAVVDRARGRHVKGLRTKQDIRNQDAMSRTVSASP
jgi:hypothetical protein